MHVWRNIYSNILIYNRRIFWKIHIMETETLISNLCRSVLFGSKQNFHELIEN